MDTQRPPGAEHGAVAPRTVDPQGRVGPTRWQASTPAWRRTGRGLYVPSDAERSASQRVVEAGALLPRIGAVTGWAALHWRGGRWFAGLADDGRTPLPVPVAATGHRVRRHPGIVVCAERFDPAETAVVDGVAVTSTLRSVCFAMRYSRSLRAAVGVLDQATYDDLCSIAEASAYVRGHPSYTGIDQARRALDLADENSWSPMETLMRLVWVLDARRPWPLTNRPVFDLDGRHVGTPDLIDPRAGVIGQYDGALHLAGRQRRRDLERDEAYRELGFECALMVTGDVADPWGFVGRLHGSYRRAASRPRDARRWTLEPPGWWQPTFTVEQRRALDATEREIWLRHRRAS